MAATAKWMTGTDQTSKTIRTLIEYREALVEQYNRMPEASWNQKALADRRREIDSTTRRLAMLGHGD
jgi:hypothetical protein